uniref:START domain-containing protein n=1 Tax=Salix viminalis TaxID=40686 RepID=A0A6N2LLX4_SALVM
MALIEALYEVLGNPSSMLGVCTEMVGLLVPLWIAFLIGLVLGWSWKPKWVTRKSDKLSCCVSKILDSSLPSSPCRSLMSPLKTFGSFSQWNSFMLRSSTCEASWAVEDNNNNNNNNLAHQNLSPVPPTEYEDCSRSLLNEEQSNVASQVAEEDLEHLYQLVEVKDGGPTWMHMMDRSTSTMSYKAWRRDPKTGPPQYRSSTVFEDASPEIVRDFFWDDDFRPKWDDMLLYSAILDECRTTGTMEYPVLLSQGEINQDALTYTIQAVESRKGDGQLTACEVLLFHYEDMGIPWEIAKLGVRQGMWGTVKKIEPGLRAYQRTRASGRTLSRPALMARINSKINPELLRSLGDVEDLSETEAATTPEKSLGRSIPKLLIVGGAIALACGFDRGLLTKAFIFSVGRRFGNMGKNAKLSAGST